jgi:hypothetical protein
LHITNKLKSFSFFFLKKKEKKFIFQGASSNQTSKAKNNPETKNKPNDR